MCTFRDLDGMLNHLELPTYKFKCRSNIINVEYVQRTIGRGKRRKLTFGITVHSFHYIC